MMQLLNYWLFNCFVENLIFIFHFIEGINVVPLWDHG